MVGSISWVINANRDGEIFKPMQIDSMLTTPMPTTADLISEPILRSSSPTTQRLLPHYSRKQVNNDDLITSINQVSQKLADYLSLIESALTTLFQRQPPSSSNLSEADRQTLGDTAAIHQDALRDKFTDQIGDTYPLADHNRRHEDRPKSSKPDQTTSYATDQTF